MGEQSRTGSSLKTLLPVHSPASSEDDVLCANSLVVRFWDPLFFGSLNVSPNNGGCSTAVCLNHLLAFDPVAFCFSPVNVPWSAFAMVVLCQQGITGVCLRRGRLALAPVRSCKADQDGGFPGSGGAASRFQTPPHTPPPSLCVPWQLGRVEGAPGTRTSLPFPHPHLLLTRPCRPPHPVVSL